MLWKSASELVSSTGQAGRMPRRPDFITTPAHRQDHGERQHKKPRQGLFPHRGSDSLLPLALASFQPIAWCVFLSVDCWQCSLGLGPQGAGKLDRCLYDGHDQGYEESQFERTGDRRHRRVLQS